MNINKYTEKAREAVAAAVELATKTWGAEHDDTLTLTGNLAVVYRRAGQPTQAIPLLDQG